MGIQFLAVLLFIILGTGIVFLAFIIGALIRRKSRQLPGKNAIYECGEPTVGRPWARLNSRFYNFALVFILFNVKIALLIPFVLAFRNQISTNSSSTGALLVFLFFFAILSLGLAYSWINGNLNWNNGREDDAN